MEDSPHAIALLGKSTFLTHTEPIEIIDNALNIPQNIYPDMLRTIRSELITGGEYSQAAHRFIDAIVESKRCKRQLDESVVHDILQNFAKRSEKIIHEKPLNKEDQHNILCEEDLVAVRAMLTPPRMQDGGYVIDTAYKATHGLVPRISLHFSLNDIVADIIGEGSQWSGNDYVIITPFSELRKRGTLVNLASADTYFEVSPGEVFRAPPSSLLLMPRGNEWYKKGRNNVIGYRGAHFSVADMRYLFDELLSSDEQGKLRADMQNVLDSISDDRVLDALYFYAEENDIDAYTAHHLLPDMFGENLFEVLGEFEDNTTIAGAVHSLIEKHRHHPLLKYFERRNISIFAFISKGIERHLRAAVKRWAVRKTLFELGYRVIPLGPHGWDLDKHRDELSSVKSLANKLGVKFGVHAGTTEKFLENMLISWKMAKTSGEQKQARHALDQYIDANYNSISLAQKRLLYHLGLL